MPPVAASELAQPTRDRTAEGALLVAEEFGFEEFIGDGRTVERHERLGGAARLPVDEAGEHLLAGAGLAADHDRGVGSRDQLGLADHREHGGIAGDQRVTLGGGRLQDRRDQLGIGRQREKLDRTGADRLHRLVRIRLEAAGDHGQVDALARQHRDQGCRAMLQLAEGETEIWLAPQDRECRIDAVDGHDLSAAFGGHRRRARELPRDGADDQETQRIRPLGPS